MYLTDEDIYTMLRKPNGLVGRQKITGHYSDSCDEWIFDSNAKGGYGETLTFHYKDDEALLKDISLYPQYKKIMNIGDGKYVLFDK